MIDLEQLKEGYIVTRTNGHYNVRKKENLSEKVRMKARIMAGLRWITGTTTISLIELLFDRGETGRLFLLRRPFLNSFG
ncbi:MAG: hypothetical protein KAV87_47835 [Desulfobacteraceae bacterium]|nr:hypothetical protein [Desulfobacteraceae bacterium]